MECDRYADPSDDEDWMATNWNDFPGAGSNEPVLERDSSENVGSKPEEKSSSLMTRMQLNDHKAGMQGLDKERINQIIYEVSKGSQFFENERRKEEQVQERVRKQEQQKRKITDDELQRGKEEADLLVSQLNASRDLTQTIVHVDMDAFYAAVEMKDNPSLLNKPMAVGGMGMLSTSNYEARKYGVRAAMPGFIGKKLCPHLTIVPPNFPRYHEISHQVQEVFAEYDPNFCPMSLDEAYLNFTQHLEKRQTLSDTQRSVIRRCQTPADPAFCRCDLNLTLKRISVETDGDSCQKNKVESASGNNSSDLANNILHSIEVIDSEPGALRPPSVKQESSTQQPSKLPNQETGSEKSALEQSALTNAAQSSTADVRDLEPVLSAVDTQCRSCGKPVPEYEVVTFGQSAEEAVREMRCRIEQRTCLTASAGIAPNMMLAKVCSDQNKPNGQYRLPSDVDSVMQFVHRLPIRKISGIGRVTEQLLGALGVSTCKDLYEQRALLYHLHSPVSFAYFMRVACGVGSAQVASAREEERKSMSTERTFGEISHPDDLYRKCQELCSSLAEDLAKEQLVGKTVSLKLKTTDFQVRTRAQTISNYTRNADAIFAIARGILRAEIQAESPKPLRLRLMGVRMSKLQSESECAQEKRQDSILGFFKKSANSACHSSPAMTSASPRMASSKSPLPGAVTLLTVSESLERQGLLTSMSSASCVVNCENMTAVTECVKQKALEKSSCSQAGIDEEETCSENLYVSSDSHVLTSCCNTNSLATDVKGSSSTKDSFNSGISASEITGFHSTEVLPKTDPSSCSSTFLSVPCTSTSSDSELPAPSSPMFHQYEENENMDTQDDSKNSSSHLEGIQSPWFVKEPSFTCPVCNKAISCINLTDFNAHIDKCLQADSKTNQHAASTPRSRQLSGSQKIPAIQKNSKAQKVNRQKNAVVKKVHNSPGTAGASSSSRTETSTTAQWQQYSSQTTGSSQQSSSQAGCSWQSDPTIAVDDFLVCPLCGAERADWTLETFNQHVDTCLNRQTITQILQEQQTAEQQPKKRLASSDQESVKASQQGKKIKRTHTSPKAGRSIVSFFKS